MRIRNTDLGKDHTVISGGGGFVRPALMADMARYGVVFAPDDGTGGGDPSPDPEPAPKSAPKPAPKQGITPPAGPSEREAQLARELEDVQKKLAGYGQATPEEVAELRKMKAEQAAREAEAAKKAKEEEDRRLREAGNFEALRERMAQEHQREMEAAAARIAELNTATNTLQSQIVNMTLNAAFSSSRFLAEETVIGSSKAHKIYGEYFDIEGGVLVPYDAPRGSARRVKIVDSRGNPKPFEEAIRQIVDADPDRDRILRPKQKPGTGMPPTQTRIIDKPNVTRGIDRLRAAVPGILAAGKQ